MPLRNVKSVILVGDRRKPNVADTIERSIPVIKQHVSIVATDLDESYDLEKLEAELAIVFGGDGAIIKTARRLGNNVIPICGVNLGKLGFLATISQEDLDNELTQMLQGKFTLLKSMRLKCTVSRSGAAVHHSMAANDIVISRGALSRIVPIDLSIDRYMVGTYNGDGLIVSTPLGSTAHSLSAGGPIVEPDIQAMIITPICPHTLSNRPLVIPSDKRIEMQIGNGAAGVGVTTDGQVFHELVPGDVVEVARCEQPLKLVLALGHNYFRTLHEKLGWSGRLGN